MLIINLTDVLCRYLHSALLRQFSKKYSDHIHMSFLLLYQFVPSPSQRISTLTFFFPMFSFNSPENIRKPLFFRSSQEDEKETLPRKGLRKTGSKCFSNHFEMSQKWILIKPVLANVPILYHLWFSGVFRGYKMGTLAKNGLTLLQTLC